MPDRYTQVFAHCDVLVVGAGPAGLAAALAAASAGARVILADEQPELGGSLLSDVSAALDGKAAASWVAETVAELSIYPNVVLMPRTTSFWLVPSQLSWPCRAPVRPRRRAPAGLPPRTSLAGSCERGGPRNRRHRAPARFSEQ